MNNHSIPSTHAERQITNLSVKLSFTHIPLLALTERITDRETNTLAGRGLEELFSSCAVVSVFGSGGE